MGYRVACVVGREIGSNAGVRAEASHVGWRQCVSHDASEHLQGAVRALRNAERPLQRHRLTHGGPGEAYKRRKRRQWEP
jgi:hypothetical protein